MCLWPDLKKTFSDGGSGSHWWMMTLGSMSRDGSVRFFFFFLRKKARQDPLIFSIIWVRSNEIIQSDKWVIYWDISFYCPLPTKHTLLLVLISKGLQLVLDIWKYLELIKNKYTLKTNVINGINRNKFSGGGRGSGGGSKQNPSDDPKQDGCQRQAAGGEGTCSPAFWKWCNSRCFQNEHKICTNLSPHLFNFKVLMLDDSLTLFQVQVDHISCS